MPTLPHQRTALENARATLNVFDKHASQDLEPAYINDPSMASEAASGKTQRSIRVLQMEAEVRANTSLRADRFVEEWTGKKAQGQPRNPALTYAHGDQLRLRPQKVFIY